MGSIDEGNWWTIEVETANWVLKIPRSPNGETFLSKSKRLLLSGMCASATAKELGFLTVQGFRHSFKREAGVAPRAWLKQQGFVDAEMARVHRAEELVLAGELSMAAVAKAVGFGAQQALTNAFYRVHGMSPTKWRLRWREGGAATAANPMASKGGKPAKRE